MMEVSRKYCPFRDKMCIMSKCNYWQQYSNKYMYETGEVGECLHKLTQLALITKLSPETKQLFYHPDDEPESQEIEVPFPV